MGIEENKAILQRLFDEVWSDNNLDVMDELFAKDFVRHGIGGTSIDFKTYKEFMVNTRRSFPDIQRSLDEMVAEGDKIAFSFTWTGTDTGGFTGVPTGKYLEVEECYIARFENGKIAEFKQHADPLGMLRELGVIPTMDEIQAQKQRQKTEEENKKTLQRYFDEIGNGRDYTNALEIMDENFNGRPGEESINGIESHKQMSAWWYSMFPDAYNDLKEMIAEGDKVLAYSVNSGTHSGTDFMEHPASGRKFNFDIMAIYTFKDGKLISGRVIPDQLKMYQQLGFYPPLPEEK